MHFKKRRQPLHKPSRVIFIPCPQNCETCLDQRRDFLYKYIGYVTASVNTDLLLKGDWQRFCRDVCGSSSDRESVSFIISFVRIKSIILKSWGKSRDRHSRNILSLALEKQFGFNTCTPKAIKTSGSLRSRVVLRWTIRIVLKRQCPYGQF